MNDQNSNQHLQAKSSEDQLPQLNAQFTWRKGGNSLNATTNDIIAIGILVLAVCAGIVGIIIAIAWTIGAVQSGAAVKTILGCVGGSTISGIVSALVGKKSSGHR
ncbi:MAG: hypothetical protein ACLPPV_02185 [Candidatus Korobacteraceae bacterium]|jgi:hypothetical protein